MRRPETRYARSGDAHIAYQVVGTGPRDLVYVPGWLSNVELNWEEPAYARFLTRLASFARLILFDKRGTGLSDRVPEQELPTLEQRMDDVRAVLDAVDSERAALFGVSEGGAMSALFSATYPERTSALVMYGSYARRQRTSDYPWGQSAEDLAASLREIEEGWGGPVGRAIRAPSAAHDERFMRFWASYLVQSASPQAALTLARMNAEIDVRPILSAIRVPTLILHREGDRVVGTDDARYLAEQIPRPSWCSSRATITCHGWATKMPCSTRSRNVSRASAGDPPWIGCSRRSCSPTSSTRRRRPPSSATRSGRACSTRTTSECGPSWLGSAGSR